MSAESTGCVMRSPDAVRQRPAGNGIEDVLDLPDGAPVEPSDIRLPIRDVAP